jgi:hypothetical protein
MTHDRPQPGGVVEEVVGQFVAHDQTVDFTHQPRQGGRAGVRGHDNFAVFCQQRPQLGVDLVGE